LINDQDVLASLDLILAKRTPIERVRCHQKYHLAIIS